MRKRRHIANILDVQRSLNEGVPISMKCGRILTSDPKTFDSSSQFPVCKTCERITAALVKTGRANPMPPVDRTLRDVLDYKPTPPSFYTYRATFSPVKKWPLAG